MKLTDIKPGMRVRIARKAGKVWVDGGYMASTIGMTGVVCEMSRNGNALVDIGPDTAYYYHPDSLEAVI